MEAPREATEGQDSADRPLSPIEATEIIAKRYRQELSESQQ